MKKAIEKLYEYEQKDIATESADQKLVDEFEDEMNEIKNILDKIAENEAFLMRFMNDSTGIIGRNCNDDTVDIEGEEKEMKTRLIKEEPLYSYYTGCEDIELFRKDFDKMKVGDRFKAEAWDRDVNATERTYVTVTCIYHDQDGVLLREHSRTVYYDGSYEDEETVELVWVELKGEKENV